MDGTATTTPDKHRPSAYCEAATDAARRIFLLGTGVVGRALVAHHARLREHLALPALTGIANSRGYAAAGDDPSATVQRLNALPPGDGACFAAVVLQPGDVVVDATASFRLASQHPDWLERGVSVVTANKQGLGGPLHRAQRLARIAASGTVHYGHSATVGAGLPVLRTLQRLVRGGDDISRIEGVLSGSMGWLFSRYDGEGFCTLVEAARTAGYTESDPRVDLDGEDVARKLLILGRSAGFALERTDIRIEPLAPPAVASTGDWGLAALDECMHERHRDAAANGARLCYVGDVDRHGGRVGLRTLPSGHPLLGPQGTDNRVAIHCSRYDSQPLVIQGAGAGPIVTACALLDDLLQALAAPAKARHP